MKINYTIRCCGMLLPLWLSMDVSADPVPSQAEVDATIAQAQSALSRSGTPDQTADRMTWNALEDYAEILEEAREKSANGDLDGALGEARKVLDALAEPGSR